MAEQNDRELSFSERCGEFLTRHRKLIACALAGACAVVAIVLITSSIKVRAAKRASAETEALISDWTDLRVKKSEDSKDKEAVIIEKLEKLASANEHTYAAFRAYTALAEMYTLRKDWEKALGFYEKAGAALPEAYTAGIAYFNAAVCADELKQHEKALEFYTASAACNDFPLKPRALFNIGRIEEGMSHKDKAISAYTSLSAAYPDNEWSLLAKSRIIALSVQ